MQGLLKAATPSALSSYLNNVTSDGVFHTPGCPLGGDGHCMELLHANPAWDAGIIPQMATNLIMNVTMRFVGSEFGKLIAEEYQRYLSEPPGARQGILFYRWKPDPLLSKVKGTRLTFPPYKASVYGDSAAAFGDMSNYGLIDCDFPAQSLEKMAWGQLRTRAPAAYVGEGK